MFRKGLIVLEIFMEPFYVLSVIWVQRRTYYV